MQFNLKLQNDFKNNIRREWALTNGLGGYAGGSVTGAINRTHQGYLIASLRSPVQRYVCFSKTNEKIVTDSHTYDLSSDQFKGGCHTAAPPPAQSGKSAAHGCCANIPAAPAACRKG